MNEDAHYQLLKILEKNPRATQRELAREWGVSVGKANYCLKALVEKGLVKANSANKLAYFICADTQGHRNQSKNILTVPTAQDGRVQGAW
jgi:predicted transcriptional regulator